MKLNVKHFLYAISLSCVPLLLTSQAKATLHDSTCVSHSSHSKVELVLEPGIEDGPMYSKRLVLRVVDFQIGSKKFAKKGFGAIGFGGRTQILQNPYRPLPDYMDSSEPFVDEQVLTASGFGGIFAFRYIREGKELKSAKLTALVPEVGLKIIDLALKCSTPVPRSD